MHMTRNDVGACLKAAFGGAASATAGGSGDNTEVDGAWVDTRGYGSLKVVIGYTAALGATETLSIAANLQDASEDNQGDADDVTGTAYAATEVAVGGAGGSTETGVVEMDFDVDSTKRWVRVQFTPDLSASGADTAIVSAVYVLGGSDENPITATVI